jgi:hypothetical protein
MYHVTAITETKRANSVAVHLVMALAFPGFFIVRMLSLTTYWILNWLQGFAIGSPMGAVIFSDARSTEAVAPHIS